MAHRTASQDPARFSLAHGGKDRHPYPVPIKVYDETIRVLKSAVQKAKLGHTEEMQALRRLDDQARASGAHRERSIAGGRSSPASARDRHRSMAARCSAGRRIIARRAAHRLTRPGMKIATFNINNVNRRLPNLLDWLQERPSPTSSACRNSSAPTRSFRPMRSSRPDITPCGAGSGPGTASPSCRADAEPIVTRTALPGDPKDEQARYIEAAIDGILVGCIYLPNGNPQPGPKFDYKLAWFKRLQAHARKLLKRRCAGRAGRRLQRRADRDRHLSNDVLG